MLHKTLITYVFFIISILFINFILVLKVPDILGYATDVKVSDLLTYTNALREKNGLSDLTLNDELSKAAKAKAADMFKDDYWAHTSPSGKEPWDFITGSGYDYIFAGENLAVDFSRSKDVVDAWNNSPSHRDNLLSSKYDEIGFAVVDGELQGRKTTLIVQMFGYQRQQNTVAALPPAVKKENPKPVEVPVAVPVDVPVPAVEVVPVIGSVLSTMSVMNASRYIALILGIFITAFISLDWFYVKRTGNLRISGNTFFHILLLLLAILGIWYTNIGLVL